ncbi:MAG: hypothetical protein C0404_09810 [Verrucomicrobia bacterium]|nr:hypothetical protein [Verrucomicrobiota bacterium]
MGRVLGVYNGQGSLITASGIGNRLIMHGRDFSWATGLYYLRLRWYDPNVGRFISKDPLTVAAGMNDYTFCRNAGINFRDPFGLCPNPSGHGRIISGSEVSYFFVGGAAVGTQLIQLDNGELVTYG